MMPPLFRRCPECGTVNWSRRFPVVATDNGRNLVSCPSCDHQFRPIDDSRLN